MSSRLTTANHAHNANAEPASAKIHTPASPVVSSMPFRFIYLHGFNSSGQSAKARQLRELLCEHEWLCPSYPAIPDRAIEYLHDFVQQACDEQHTTILVGSSLGGFYAQYLARLHNTYAILINPALDPVTVLRPYLGIHNNFYTGETYRFSEAELNMLHRYEVNEPCVHPVPTLLLLDQGDEIIPYEHALQRYQSCASCHVFSDGDHNFVHVAESIEVIRRFLVQAVQTTQSSQT